MGTLITSEPPPSTTDYDRWKLYRASSASGTYSVINGTNGQAITDLTYYDSSGTSVHWYKISYYDTDASNESALSDPFQGLAQTYTTVKKISSFLGLRTAITDSTTPTVQQIVEIINRIEDEIDWRTGHAWRTRYSGTTSGNDQTAKYEYYDVLFDYEYQKGRPVYLKHRKVLTLDSGEGDVLEIWNGASYDNWLSDKSEARGSDFWLDYEMGKLFIKARYSVKGGMRLRMKYRYGEQIINRIIEDIATKMVSMDLLTGDSNSVIVQEGANNVITNREKISLWTKQIEDKLAGLKEFQFPSVSY